MALFSIKDLVAANLYDSEAAAVEDALRHLLRARADLRVKLAVHQYTQSEISLAKAAQMAGVSWAQMREILLEQGAVIRLGPETLEEAREEIRVVRQHTVPQTSQTPRRIRKNR